MGLFTKSKSAEGSGKSWIPDAIEFECGDEGHNDSSTSALDLPGVKAGGGVDNSNNRGSSRGPHSSASAKKKNPFDIEYESTSSDDDDKKQQPSHNLVYKTAAASKKASNNNSDYKSSELQKFEASMKQYEEKISAIDKSSFMKFDDDDNDDDDDSSSNSTPLSGIEEWSGEGGGNNNNRENIMMGNPKRKSSKKKGLFGKNKQNGSMPNTVPPPLSSPSPPSALSIGVPNTKGGKLTIGQLEDELYLYKLETLNLTDACRELADQLEETEQKLESVQAQATFRIHALEAELQDGNIGMKSLVKMTSTEMDGRLDALRALGKTATIQANQLKRRDHELLNVEQQLRRTRRDVKALKRENQKVSDERKYLKERLDELEHVRHELERTVNSLQSEQSDTIQKVSMEGKMKVDKCVQKLNETLEELVLLNSQIDMKEKEIDELRDQIQEKDEEIDQMKKNIETKEHDIVRVELQLEKVRNDLLEAACATEASEAARVEAVESESKVRSQLDETLNMLAVSQVKVAKLESREDELMSEIEAKTLSAEEEHNLATQKAKLHEVEVEVTKLREENQEALEAAAATKSAHVSAIMEREAQIDTLNRDIQVHHEQMVLAQSMLEEKEIIASELHLQLVETKEEMKAKILELEDELALKSREVSKVNAELEVRTNDVNELEKKIDQMRMEYAGKQGLMTNAVALHSISEEPVHLDGSHLHEALLAEKELQITRMDRELGTSKRYLDAMHVELQEKDKTIDRLKTNLDELKNKKTARVKELEAQLDSKSASMESLQKELEAEKQLLYEMEAKLRNVQADLVTALEASKDADEARGEAVAVAQQSKIAEIAAQQQCEKLKAQNDSLQEAKEKVDAQLEAAKYENDKDTKSSTQAAAALAATNAARQAEMEMKIEKMQKEIEFKKREMDAIKSELREKDQAATRLKGELQAVRQEMANYKESIESEKEIEVLQRIADQDYFEDDETTSQRSFSNSSISTGNRASGKFLGLFGRNNAGDNEDDENIDWKKKSDEKDARIEFMQRTLTDNALTISNLRQELVTSASKFKEDESQRRLLIQRLENENQAYSIKLEVLENEFNEIKQGKEKVLKTEVSFSRKYSCDDGSLSSNGTGSLKSGYTGASSVTGASKYTPLERDNKKLTKQKKIYENRIKSLQTQLSEIQQIVPELMSKSKSQISKLESVIQTKKDEASKREKELKDEIENLKKQNSQLQAATRSRLQESDNDRQDEIDQLRMKLEAREATIAKLEIINKSFKRGGSLMGKKKKKGSKSGDGESIASDLD